MVADERRDLDWHRKFSHAVLNAVFEIPTTDYFQGPDGAWYYRYLFPTSSRFNGRVLGASIDNVLLGFNGVAIFDQGDDPLFVLSPGDIVSLKLYGQVNVTWGGKWSLPGRSEVFTQAKEVRVGAPNLEFLPSLARASVKHVLILGAQVAEPKVLCFAQNEPVAATNLVFNVFSDDFEPNRYQDVCRLVLHFLPRHLGRRTCFVGRSVFPESSFTLL